MFRVVPVAEIYDTVFSPSALSKITAELGSTGVSAVVAGVPLTDVPILT
jgi:hypothetical protein